MRTLAFSPDSRGLAAGMGMGVDQQGMPAAGTFEIWLWNLDKDEQPLRFHGHNGPVLGIVFLPDGKRMVSFSMDWTMRHVGRRHAEGSQAGWYATS